MIRGAIAFGLVLKVGKEGLIKSGDNVEVITTTAITLVVGTTLLFGSTMPRFRSGSSPSSPKRSSRSR